MDVKRALSKIRELIKEDIYHAGLKKVNVGDNFDIVSDKNTFNGKVVDKYSNHITVQINGKNYLFTPTSLEGEKLQGIEKVDGQNISRTMLGVKHIVIRRNGNTVTTLTADGEEETDFEDEDDDGKHGPQVEDIFIDCQRALKTIEKDDKIVITIGELKNEFEMTGEAVGIIEVHARVIYENGAIVCTIQKADGKLNDDIDAISDDKFTISKSKSLQKNENGVVLMVADKDKNRFFINNILSIEKDEFESIPMPSFDELMQDDKGFKDLMLKEPSLMGKISGEMAKGVIPANNALKKLGLTHSYFTQGKKVRFTYSGEKIRPGKKLSLRSGKEYVGIFSTSRSIKLIGTNRGENLLVKLKKKTEGQIYEVEIEFHKVRDGEEITQSLGRGIIQIKDINFR